MKILRLFGLPITALLLGACAVVGTAVMAPVLALAIPLFALEMVGRDLDRFFREASALPANSAVLTSFARLAVPVDGFVAQPGTGSADAVTLVSRRGEANAGYGGRFDAASFPTPAGARTPREALYRQAALAGQQRILDARKLVSGAEVNWRGFRCWSFEAVLPVGLDGQPAWCRGMLLQKDGRCYFLARSVPLRSEAARLLDPSSPEAQQAREEFRGFLARFEPKSVPPLSATRLGGAGALDLPR